MNQKRFLRIRKFDDYQHYKDRNPIWIKLYCSILDDYDFAGIPDETKFHAVALLLLASRLNNKFPDDERWLRQKINANVEINLKILLEIGFLEVIKVARNRNKNDLRELKDDLTDTLDDSKVLKANDDFASTEQNRREEKKTEHNTTEHGETASGVECVPISDFGIRNADLEKQSSKIENPQSEITNSKSNKSQFSIDECFQYVGICKEKGEDIKNPKGLANHLYKTGEADSFILAALFPEKHAEVEKIRYGEPRQFSDEPCPVCFGAKMANPDGKGFRKCANCLDEKGKATGFEPLKGI